MTTQQIHFFLEAARCLNFTQAAQNLYTSQPTLSKAIAAMEDELGFKLFYRQYHALTLTSAGLLMRNELGKLEDGLRRALDHAARLDKAAEGHISCAILDIIDPTPLIFPALERFQRKYPKVEVEIQICGFREIRDRLQERRIDVVFNKHFELRDIANLERMAVDEVTPSIMVPEDHPLTRQALVSGKQLKDESFIVLALDECPSHLNSLIDLCLKDGFYPKVSKYAGSNAAKIAYVHLGYGIALFDEEVAIPEWARVRLIPLSTMRPSDGYTPNINMAWHQDNLNQALPLFRDTVAETLAMQNNGT